MHAGLRTSQSFLQATSVVEARSRTVKSFFIKVRFKGKRKRMYEKDGVFTKWVGKSNLFF